MYVHQDCVVVTGAAAQDLLDGNLSVLRLVDGKARIRKDGEGDLAIDLVVFHEENAHLRKVERFGIRRAGLALRQLLLGSWLWRKGKRKPHNEFRALVLFGLDLDRSLHQIDDALCDRHAKPRSLCSVHGGSALALERVEDALQEISAHAESVVLHPEFVEALAVFRGRILDERGGNAPSGGRKLPCIADKIEEDSVQTTPVAHDAAMRNARDIDAEIEVLLVHLRSKQIGEFVEDGDEIDRHRFKLDLARLDSAHLEDVGDERQEVVARRLHLRHVFTERRFRHALPFGEFDVADYGVHRRSDVVAYGGEERALCTIPGLGLRLRDFEHLLAAPLCGVETEHDDKRENQKCHLHDIVALPVGVKDVHKPVDVTLLVVEGVGVGGAVVFFAVPRRILDYRANRAPCRPLRREPHPHKRREEDEDDDASPDDRRTPEPLVRVVLESVPVEREAADAPKRQDEIRLRRKRIS